MLWFTMLMGFSTVPSGPCGGGLEYGGVRFPAGEKAFAIRVVSFRPGSGVSAEYGDASTALGVPDWTPGKGAVSLGVPGEQGPSELVLGFGIDIVDGRGDDLFVFEIGPSAERTELAVSVDGRAWVHVGVIEGHTRAVDLAGSPAAGGRWRYVRLRSAENRSSAPWAGPDIDAVGILSCPVLNS